MVSPEKQEVLRWFAEGRESYKLMDFSRAKACFASALQIDKDDGPSRVYYYRCAHYLENSSADDRDGISVMKVK